MQHFRKVTSLAEDMANLGLVVQESAEDLNKLARRNLGESTQLDESEDAEQLDEISLKRVRTKRMSSGARAKARIAARKHKAQNNRKRRLLHKKSSYKKKAARIAKAKKGKKTGGRIRLRVASTLGAKANMLENFNLTAEDIKSLTRQDLAKSFLDLGENIGALARKFTLIDAIIESEEVSLGLEPMKAEDMAAPADDEKEKVEADAAPEADDKDKVQEDDEDADPAMEACDDDSDEMSEEDQEAEKKMESRLASMPMDYELSVLRMQCEEAASDIAQGKMSPVFAAGILGDVANYLGAATAMLDATNKEMEGYGIIGKDEPGDAGEEPNKDAPADHGKPVGDGVPDGGSPQVPGSKENTAATPESEDAGQAAVGDKIKGKSALGTPQAQGNANPDKPVESDEAKV